MGHTYFVKRQLQVRFFIEEKGHDESNCKAQKFLLHMLRFFECICEFLWSWHLVIHYLSDLKPRLSLFGVLLGIFTSYHLSKHIAWLCSGKPELRWSIVNPDWHEQWKQEKWSSLVPPRGIFYKTKWAWQGAKLTWLMSIFTSKTVSKILIKVQLTKYNPKRTKGWKVPSLMPIRVKCS